MNDGLIVQDLWKSYGSHPVLQGMSFKVSRGEVVALLGINGAGKTTTLECIEGLRRPDSGSVLVQGCMSAQLQAGNLPEYLRGREILELFTRWNGKYPDPGLAARMGVAELERKQYRAMSTGQKRRLHLVLALIRRPDVLLLDEPTAGLDVEGRVAIHKEIRTLREQGSAILLSTHDLSEVKEICDRLVLLRDGHAAFDGTPAEFGDTAGIPSIIHVRTPEGVESLQAEDIGAALSAFLERCRARSLPVLDVQVERGTMEEQFLKLSKGA